MTLQGKARCLDVGVCAGVSHKSCGVVGVGRAGRPIRLRCRVLSSCPTMAMQAVKCVGVRSSGELVLDVGLGILGMWFTAFGKG